MLVTTRAEGILFSGCLSNISVISWGNFFKYGTNMPLDSKMNWLDFGGQRSRSPWPHKTQFWPCGCSNWGTPLGNPFRFGLKNKLILRSTVKVTVTSLNTLLACWMWYLKTNLNVLIIYITPSMYFTPPPLYSSYIFVKVSYFLLLLRDKGFKKIWAKFTFVCLN